jgi:hypothetical protein
VSGACGECSRTQQLTSVPLLVDRPARTQVANRRGRECCQCQQPSMEGSGHHSAPANNYGRSLGPSSSSLRVLHLLPRAARPATYGLALS